MDQLPYVDPPTVRDAPTGRPSPDCSPSAADRRLERSSRVVLKAGAAMATVFVLRPGVGLAAVMVFLASLQTWHGGEGDVTVEDRLTFLAVALLAIGFVVACAVALRRSLRRDWIASCSWASAGWPAPTPARAASSRRPHRQPDHGPVLGRRCDRRHAAARRITGHGDPPAT
jgi:hypothetical protein